MRKRLRRKIPFALLAAAYFGCCTHNSLAQDYAECREKCTSDYTDCMNEPQGSESEVETAKEASCTEKMQLCYSDCENLRTPDTDSNQTPQPEANPNIIVR